MSDSPKHGGILLAMAGEQVVRVMAGCAKRLRPDLSAEAAEAADAFGEERAINVFGPAILPGWVAWLNSHDEKCIREAVEQLAAISPADAKQAVDEILIRSAPDADAHDRSVVMDYLSGIPAATRDTLVPDPFTGHLSLPKTVTLAVNQLAHRMLPSRVPPFPAKTELPETPYVLEELLGCGGFGAVYKASNRFEQHAPPRALKFCLNRIMVATLERERDVLDRLMAAGRSSDWSNRIVTLFGHSLNTPIPFLVYEYVPGGALPAKLTSTQRKVGRKLYPNEVLNIVRQVAEGLAFAHAHGLVHRDIKPANILVGKDSLKLADFGIGGAVSSHANATSEIGVSEVAQLTAGDRASLFRGSGTPLYMSPEQRRGDPPDPRHDIYSLGVMWFQILMGDVTRELHPGWNEELLDEFQVPLNHVEVIQRCVGYFKKRPRHGSELLELLTLLKQTKQPGDITDAKEGPASSAVPVGSSSAEMPVITRATTAPASPPSTVGEIVRFHRHTQKVTGVVLSSDQRSLVSCSADGTIRQWNVETASETTRLTGHKGTVSAVNISPDGRHIVSAGEDGTVRVWIADSGKSLHVIKAAHRPVVSLALPKHGKWIASGAADGAIALWDLSSGRRLRQLVGHSDVVSGIGFTPDGLSLVSGGSEGTLRIWDVKSGTETARHDVPAFTCFSLSPDGKAVVTGGTDATVRVWRLSDGERLSKFNAGGRAVESVAVSPNGQRLLSGGADNCVRLWDFETTREIQRFEGHTNWVKCVRFSPDGKQAVSGGMDMSAILWSLPD
jgi:serine/threonine protein kinase